MGNDASDYMNQVRNRFRQALKDHNREDERLVRLFSELRSTSDDRMDELHEQERKANDASDRYEAARTEYVNSSLSQLKHFTLR